MAQGHDKDYPPDSKPAAAWGGFAAKMRTNQAAMNSWHAGSSAPTGPEDNQRWLDTSVTPPVLKIYDQATTTWKKAEEKVAIFMEIATARGSAASLNARLSVALGADGTLIPAASLNTDEFKAIAGTYTRTGASTFTVTGDKTAIFVARRRVKMVGDTTTYSEVVSSVFGATTEVTIVDTNVPTNMTADTTAVGLVTPTAASTALGSRGISSPSGGYVEDYLAELVTARNGLASLNTRILRKNRVPFNGAKNGDVELWAAGAAAAPDNWTLAGAGAAAAREATIIKHGTYSAKLTRAGTDCQLLQDVDTQFGAATYVKGRTFTFGAWVYATVASRARIYLNDGDSVTYSSYHTGGSAWEFLTVTKTCHASATTKLDAALQVDTGDTSGYIDGAMVVEGDEAYAFSPHPVDALGLPAGMHALANRNGGGRWIEYGTTDPSGTGGGDNTIHAVQAAGLTYAVAFSAPPVVKGGGTTTVGSGPLVGPYAITTTGFGLHICSINGAVDFASVGWEATGV